MIRKLLIKFSILLCGFSAFAGEIKPSDLERDRIWCQGKFYGDAAQIAKCRQMMLEGRYKMIADEREVEERANQREYEAYIKAKKQSDEEIQNFKREPLPKDKMNDSFTATDGRVCTKANIYDIDGKVVRTDERCW